MHKLSPLFALYFAQGLPFGFQATAFPLLLRERGVSLEAIGFASLLSAPWLLKALWAPLVDRFGNARFGRRKSWIVPMQAGLALTALLAAQTEHTPTLAALILLMNVFAATQDIAVDALAVSWLDAAQLGPANALQVGGYKLGMLTGGGLLVWASASTGWTGLFYAIAALMTLVMAISLCIRETASEQTTDAPLRTIEMVRRLGRAIKRPQTAAVITIVTTYKLGESMADAMWKPMLLDRGFSSAEIGLWAGTFGLLASLVGSGLAGFAVRAAGVPVVLLWTAVVRTVGVAGEWWIGSTPQASAVSVIGVTCLEHLAGGALTTVLFALMMGHTDREIGATHYTLLASLEVWGKLPLAALSGIVAVQIGYSGLFGVATGLCIAFALLVRILLTQLSVTSNVATASQ